MIDWWFRDRATGRVVVAQWPNAPLVIFLVARVGDRVLAPSGPWLDVVGTVALLWWAGDEVLRGVNPFRRVLGAVIAAATLAGLVW